MGRSVAPPAGTCRQRSLRSAAASRLRVATLIFLSLAAAAVLATEITCSPRRRPPNVVLLILDAVRKTGNWSAATSKETIGCGVWAFQIRIVMADSCGKSNTITFAKVRAKADKEMTDEGLRLTINCTAYGDGSGGPAYTIT